MPSICNFILERERAVFYAGTDVIAGFVILFTSSDKTINHIDLGFKGWCKVINTVTADIMPAMSQGYVIGEDLFAKEYYVREKIRIVSEGVLEPGRHSWPFRFYVPPTCMTSLEGRYGHIRYHLYLKINNQGKYKNHFIRPITVIKTTDLNVDRNFLRSQVCELKVSCCFGTNPFKLFCCLSTALAGYAPGQTMMYTLKFYEKSVDKISYYTVSFIREMQFIAIFPRPISQKVRTVLCTNEILDNGNTDQVVIGNIIIPSVTSTIYTKYITVEYVLELEVKLNVSATKFKAKIPIVIGTVPLRQSLDAQQDHLVEPIMVPNESGGVSMRYIIRAPTFEKALRIDTGFVDSQKLPVNRADDFMPLYPSYKVVPAAEN